MDVRGTHPQRIVRTKKNRFNRKNVVLPKTSVLVFSSKKSFEFIMRIK